MTPEIKQRFEQIRRGEVPEGYKRVAQYIIPVEWNGVKLSDLGTWTGGGTPSKGETEYWENGTIYWISSQEVKKPTLRETTYMITERAVQESSTTLVPENSVIIVARSGILQHSLPVAKTEIPMAINQDIKALVLNESSDVDYIVSAIINQEKPILREYTKKGTTVESLLFETFSKYIIPYATTNERREIASILTTQDKVIELKEKLLSEKQRQKKYLMQQLLTGKKRLAGFSGEWKEIKLCEVLSERKEKNVEGNLRICSVAVQKGVVDQVEHLGRSYAASDTSNYSVVHYGDIIYTKSPTGDFPYGIIKQSLLEETVAVSPLYGVFTPMTFELGYILNTYFQSAVNAANYLLPIIQKGAKNTINITNGTFLSNKLYLPLDEKEQEKLANVFIVVDRELEMLQKNIEQEKQKKKALMQLLLTGIVRVKV